MWRNTAAYFTWKQYLACPLKSCYVLYYSDTKCLVRVTRVVILFLVIQQQRENNSEEKGKHLKSTMLQNSVKWNLMKRRSMKCPLIQWNNVRWNGVQSNVRYPNYSYGGVTHVWTTWWDRPIRSRNNQEAMWFGADYMPVLIIATRWGLRAPNIVRVWLF